MDLVQTSDPIRSRRAVLWTGLVVSLAVAVGEFIVSPGAPDPYRIGAALLITALTAYELIGDERTEVVLVGTAIIFAILSLVELRTGLVRSYFDPGSTLGLLILLGVLFAATRDALGSSGALRRSVRPNSG